LEPLISVFVVWIIAQPVLANEWWLYVAKRVEPWNRHLCSFLCHHANYAVLFWHCFEVSVV